MEIWPWWVIQCTAMLCVMLFQSFHTPSHIVAADIHLISLPHQCWPFSYTNHCHRDLNTHLMPLCLVFFKIAQFPHEADYSFLTVLGESPLWGVYWRGRSCLQPWWPTLHRVLLQAHSSGPQHWVYISWNLENKTLTQNCSSPVHY